MTHFDVDPSDFREPLPEAIHEGQWDVRHGPPSVSIANRLFSAPLDASTRSYHIRRHEIGRAHWFPTDVGPASKSIGCHPRTLLAVEDAVINCTCTNIPMIGKPNYVPTLKEQQFLSKRISSIPDLRNRILSALSLSFSDMASQLSADMDPNEMKVITTVEAMLVHGAERVPTDGSVEIACLWLEAMFDKLQSEKNISDGYVSAMDLQKFAQSHAGDATKYKKGLKRSFMGFKPGIGTGSCGWCKVKWHYPPLDQRLPGRKMGRKKYAQEYGAVPKRMYRWGIDGCVFERVVKGPGGGILLDASGSMKFSAEDLYTILTSVPNCTVAMYCSRGSIGHISLIAHKGRCVTEEVLSDHRFGSGNGIDGPSLRWLSTIKKPLYWISDGCVTGSGDEIRENLVLECAAICADSNIKRIATIKRALDFFKSKVVHHDTFRNTESFELDSEPPVTIE